MSTNPPRAAPDPSRFHEQRPTDLRVSPWRHPLAYIIRRLPLALEDLAGDLRVPRCGRVLDFGCADMPYRRFFAADVDFVGADLPGNPLASLELRADGTLAVEDACFDAVLATQTLEHVADPRTYLAESFRLLRPGGRMLLSTHGVMAYHPDPVDYWRWTCAGLRREVEQAGFRVVRFEGIMGLAATGLQLLQDGSLPGVPRRLQPAFCAAMQSLILLADRLESSASRELNALVFALVAEKP